MNLRWLWGNYTDAQYELSRKEQHELRKHMAIFINGIQIRDRLNLSDPVGPNDVIDVMQALSGG